MVDVTSFSTDSECVIGSYHSPAPRGFIDHHILPKSWGGQTVEDNLIRLCPTHHRNVHEYLDLMVQYGGLPPASQRQHFGLTTRLLAGRAWSQRPSDTPPRTVTSTDGA